ncbi:MAG: hypothetical protein IJK62_01160 [Bacteroidales bacterium]|nr:hypothetical protein [Bacteroidales bacterium]
MRKIELLAALAMCIAAVSCGNSKSDKVENDVASQDSLPVADTVVVEAEEVAPEPVFITPDLAFMEVHGHVKSVEYPGGRKAVFDEKGNLVDYATEYSGETGVQIGRDDDGYIVSTYDGPGGSAMYDYDKENMRLVLTAGGDGAYYSECHLEYDEEGNIIRYNFVDEDMAEDTRDEWSLDVEIVTKDEQGNWTELKVDDGIAKREIVYF